jgi:hypothetical protein
MGIIDAINKKRNAFQQERIKNTTIRLSRNIETRKQEAALMKMKEEDNKNREYINSIKHSQRDKAIAGLRGFAAGVRNRTVARSAKRGGIVNFGRTQSTGREGNIFTSSGGTNPLYHGSNPGASNIYHNLGSAATITKKKGTVKKVIFYE